MPRRPGSPGPWPGRYRSGIIHLNDCATPTRIYPPDRLSTANEVLATTCHTRSPAWCVMSSRTTGTRTSAPMTHEKDQSARSAAAALRTRCARNERYAQIAITQGLHLGHLAPNLSPRRQDPPHLAAPHGAAGIPGRLGQESWVYCAGARSSATGSFPAPSRASRPGGSEWAMAMMADRRASVIRCPRPAPAGSRARRRRLRRTGAASIAR